MKCMSFIQLTTSTDFITISERFFLQTNFNKSNHFLSCDLYAGPILESKGMHAIFQKKGKIFEGLSKNVQNLTIFLKRAGDCMQLSHAINC